MNIVRSHRPASSLSQFGRIVRISSMPAIQLGKRAHHSNSKAPRIWPAPSSRLEAARDFIKECTRSSANVLLVPDRDADGLASGTILSLAMQLLSKPAPQIHTHFVSAGRSIFSSEERSILTKLCRDKNISHMVVLDQGSRSSPPLVEAGTKVLVIDHHQSKSFPDSSTVVNSCDYHPIATSSLLTYIICTPLHPQVQKKTSWLAVLGIFGDLGPQTKLVAPYPPELQEAKKKYRATHLTTLVALVNAPRRTPECNTVDAWNLLQHAPDDDPAPTPKRILDGEVDGALIEKLRDARVMVKTETERCAHSAPTFSRDGRVAVVYMESAYQVHPVVGMRWAGILKGKNLEVVLAANGGYVEGKVNFSCRPVRGKRAVEGADDGVDIIALLKEYAGKDQWVKDNVGEEFANGHRQAAGGSLKRDVWVAFAGRCLELGVKGGARGATVVKGMPESSEKGQNSLDSWLKKG